VAIKISFKAHKIMPNGHIWTRKTSKVYLPLAFISVIVTNIRPIWISHKALTCALTIINSIACSNFMMLFLESY